MPRPSPIRLAASLAFSALLTTHLSAQQPQPNPAASTLPVTQPTQPLTPAQLPAHRAEVIYANGVVSVTASNSSLNQILREISHLTGIKISGGVSDERVFGKYGPGTPSAVLDSLLDGTGTNMLLVQGTGPTPQELLLTPRQGGASPPNPNARAEDNNDVPDPSGQQYPGQFVHRPVRPPAIPGVTPDQSQPAPADPSSSSTPVNPTSSDPAQQSPNAVKTPQEIYDQLQKLRQQQQQQQDSANPK